MIQSKEDTEEEPVEKKTPRAKLSQKTIDLLAEAAESAFDAELTETQPPNPPFNPPINPPEPLSDQIAKFKDGVGCPHETSGGPNGETNGEANSEPEGKADEEMPPLVDETEV